jgi:peptidoglycan/LPS O-acetylase OafA/YrhL
VLVAEPILRSLTPPLFYRLTPFELDGLAAGSLLALVLEGGIVLPKANGWFVLMFLPVFWFVTSPLANSYLALLFVLFVGWVAGLDDGIFYRLLSLKPLTYIGRISYGIYLYHIPVSVAMHRIGLRFPWDILPVFPIASLSFHFIEKPIMNGGFAKIWALMNRRCPECGNRVGSTKGCRECGGFNLNMQTW